MVLAADATSVRSTTSVQQESVPHSFKWLRSIPGFGGTILYPPRLLTTLGCCHSPASRARSRTCLSRVSKYQWDMPPPAPIPSPRTLPGTWIVFPKAVTKEAGRCHFQGPLGHGGLLQDDASTVCICKMPSIF